MNELPSLNALHAFARIAENGSFAEAAKVLNVTPAAVSQKVRRLEQFFDAKLLQKHGRGVLLSEDGQILSRATLNGLAQMMQGGRSFQIAPPARRCALRHRPALRPIGSRAWRSCCLRGVRLGAERD